MLIDELRVYLHVVDVIVGAIGVAKGDLDRITTTATVAAVR